jgi:hypothetical protein
MHHVLSSFQNTTPDIDRVNQTHIVGVLRAGVMVSLVGMSVRVVAVGLGHWLRFLSIVSMRVAISLRLVIQAASSLSSSALSS